jgi:tungstate transport system substrate-binding protein
VNNVLRTSRLIFLVTVLLLLIITILWIYSYYDSNDAQRIIVSTTTSLYETGLLDALKDDFENLNPSLNISYISQGTGLAIQTAMRGDADMILVHDPVREALFLEDGFGLNRKIIAYNFFVIIGPTEDPARIEGLPVADALLRIKEAGEEGRVEWISRGDDSGTHSKEKSLWNKSGEEVSLLREEEWYLESGSGMTSTLRIADERRAYTLCDIGTYLRIFNNGAIDLEILIESGKETLNVYSAIVSNPEINERISSNFNLSMKFIRYLVSDRGQEIINAFGVDEFGTHMFNSYTKLQNSLEDFETYRLIQESAFIDGMESPVRFRYQADDLYSRIED